MSIIKDTIQENDDKLANKLEEIYYYIEDGKGHKKLKELKNIIECLRG